jgi:O-antigen ligase
MLAIISGLVFFLFYGFYYFGKNLKYILIAVFSFVIIGFLAFQYIPALQLKYGMTVYDLEQYRENNPDNYSISMRIETLKVGWEVFKKNKWIGVGPSEMGNKMKEMYELTNSKLTLENRWNPHNQFLYNFAAFGTIGGVLFVIMLFLPLFSGQLNNPIFMIFWVVSLSTMLIEAIHERQIGIAFFVIFWSILQLEKKNVN